jgi:hypothetical protein
VTFVAASGTVHPSAGWRRTKDDWTESDMNSLVRNTSRALLGIILAAAATWLTNFIIDQVFGPEEEYE